ncbi:MAG: diaminopimelate epimerase [Xanthomonadales bacterium]|nr:diaminopimelate epimerase [Gammaproteobacteria bacterium]MBT8054842.1 diaminopimelate epimerase [Gammaproteobacteria bacterium]NND58523.1 diaminopimelate epimerase [Xanthomonadales bacterium]NNK51107.1 diaminopimelate epimerase [Xanthomonadales bacterium]
MALKFHKMHGAGNDFVLIDSRDQEFLLTPERASRIADRHLGVGCDQILVLRDAESQQHRARYEIWNADGSNAGQCGNGARCIGLYLEMYGEAGGTSFSVESPAGVVTMRRCGDGEYEVEMGRPAFESARVPINLEPEDDHYHLDSPWGVLEFGAVSMGNPHALLITRDIDSPEIPAIGAFVGHHDVFPKGCNTGFAQLAGPKKIYLRVVERGAGETLACGSGACAAVALLHRSGRVHEEVNVILPGGHLVIKCRGNGEPLTMKGPAEHVFRGTLNE